MKKHKELSMYCPSCESSREEEEEYCYACGRPLLPKEYRCPECDSIQRLHAGQIFCVHCGKPVDLEVSDESSS